MRNLALMWVVAGVAVALLAAGEGKPSVSTFTDSRDGKVYRIARVGGQVWTAENLNYAAEGSKCYEDSPDSCAKYGRLYDWTTAPKACPAGWHLSIGAEWDTLVEYAGGREMAGTKLKSSTGWEPYDSVPAGTDDYGFSACVAGGKRGFWWSAMKNDTNGDNPGYRMMMFNREYVDKSLDYRGQSADDYRAYSEDYDLRHRVRDLIQLRRAYENDIRKKMFPVRCVRNDSAYNAAAANLVRIQAASGTFTDPRDGKKYRTIKINNQKWMAENLNYAAEGSKCYGEGGSVILGWDSKMVADCMVCSYSKPITITRSDAEAQAYCAKYGRLYDWETAKNACPAGWHLPSDDEWTALTDYAGGGDSTAGTTLKSSTGWYYNYNVPFGTDEYGFSALSGGRGSFKDFTGAAGGYYFRDAGNESDWWSATKTDFDTNRVWKRYMDNRRTDVVRSNSNKALLFYVRCVADK
jgi:uncharacterized protein (TIGR02145 family)